ncbi:hypothetical protein HPB47_017380 [Ixodes persulcatus]|uniref:Uncharacterized protein n=1 Tax=Ixodes persulcatus TaxID=34615 RepID=A0AC60QNE6_IXOPE|nr:hypothetical protein HPB47_017380 [Ixodes persulcatus]
MGYFSDGMAVSEARRLHESKLCMEENGPELLANGTLNPLARTVQHWHTVWRSACFGGGPIDALSSWRRRHPSMLLKALEAARDIVFIDSTSSCDTTKCTVTVVLVATMAGAVPLAVLLHNEQSTEGYSAAFKLLSGTHPLCFGGLSRERLPTKRRKVLPYACDLSATSDSNEASPEPAAESPDVLPRNDRRRLRDTRWCCCESRCGTMPTPVESVCCKEQHKVKEKAGSLPCITMHRLFELYCLNRDILDLEYRKLRVCRPLSTRNIKQINAKYRYTAYCQFVWWVHGRLGKENRVTLPSCVVTRVRKEFPAPNPVDYTGFKQS